MEKSVNVDVTLNEQLQLHSIDRKPAVIYEDGQAEYWVKNVRVPDFVVTHPERIKLDDINKEANTEVRRIMMEAYGYEKYLKNSKATLISEDAVGKLWSVPVPADEPLVMVEVLNSTPEPDGSIKTYFLRVPPNIRTPRQGIGWTFNLDERQYDPVFQS